VPIPKTREELVGQIEKSFQKLDHELSDLDTNVANQICIDDWSVKDLVAVRLWWTKNVLDWINEGKGGAAQLIPAKGYSWNETPRLNEDIVKKSKSRSYKVIVDDLRKQYGRINSVIESLTEEELFVPGFYQWAGKMPISRWLSINTTRQYETARSHIRKTKKAHNTSSKQT